MREIILHTPYIRLYGLKEGELYRSEEIYEKIDKEEFHRKCISYYETTKDGIDQFSLMLGGNGKRFASIEIDCFLGDHLSDTDTRKVRDTEKYRNICKQWYLTKRPTRNLTNKIWNRYIELLESMPETTKSGNFKGENVEEKVKNNTISIE